jgi:predicted O-linked N-acetylglucosamine transferase (SPINDLY family)
MSSQPAIQRALHDAGEGRITNAVASMRLVLKLSPNDLEALSVMGMLLVQAGQPEQALLPLTRAVSLAPGSTAANNNLANALLSVARYEDAVKHYERALAAEPANTQAMLGLVLALTHLERTDRAVEVADQGLRIAPDWPMMNLNRANALSAADRLDEAIVAMRSVLAKDPTQASLRAQLLSALNYLPLSRDEVFEEHRGYAASVRGDREATQNDPDPERPLRIGILSGDLRTHSVGFFAEPFMRHMPAGWKLVAFSTSADRGTDAMTRGFRAMCDDWVEAGAMNDAALDRAIREHGIDVLVELGGHTAGGRLSALDRKPAPVIVSAIGYPNTTGHPCVDWRIVDSTTDPAGADAFCTERLARIDPCFLCYSPFAEAPQPAMPAAGTPFTFGSFNLAAKVREQTVELWSAALARVPGSRLLLKSKSISDPALLRRLMARLEAGGIDPSRVDVAPYTKTNAEHLALYSRVHVALDCTPYNGTTTTCEALWMGVPVVCIAGDRHAARVGASLLHAAGCGEFLASTPAQFAEIAAGLAQDHARLAELRTGLRARLSSSPLMDQQAYATRFHAALRECWREHCRAAAR